MSSERAAEKVVSARGFPVDRRELARRLALPAPAPVPEDRHIFGLPADARVTEAAVMLPLVQRDGAISVLLTQRTPHLNDHAGQISFPGGRVEPDDPSREATALRETEEEIGLAAARIEVLGRLPVYEVPSGFRITPVVGWIDAPFDLAPDTFEVAEVFEVPVAHFLNPAHYVRREYHYRERHRHYLAVPYEGRYIWGATAGMLWAFAHIVRAGRW